MPNHYLQAQTRSPPWPRTRHSLDTFGGPSEWRTPLGAAVRPPLGAAAEAEVALNFPATFSDANPGSAAAQLGSALLLDATELRLVPSPVLSAEPGKNAAAAADCVHTSM